MTRACEDGLFSLREHQSRLSVLADCCLFREQFQPLRPLFSSSQESVRKTSSAEDSSARSRASSRPDSPPSQTILEICLWGSGLSVHGPSLRTVSGSPHFYEVHGRGCFPSKADGNPYSQLPWRLACLGPVRGRTNITQDPPPQPLRVPGTQGQFRQEYAVPQPVNIIPGNNFRFSSDESGSHTRSCTGHAETRGLLRDQCHSPLEFQFTETTTIIQTIKIQWE